MRDGKTVSARPSLERTEALAEAVPDFQTAADLAAWLAALPLESPR